MAPPRLLVTNAITSLLADVICNTRTRLVIRKVLLFIMDSWSEHVPTSDMNHWYYDAIHKFGWVTEGIACLDGSLLHHFRGLGVEL